MCFNLFTYLEIAILREVNTFKAGPDAPKFIFSISILDHSFQVRI